MPEDIYINARDLARQTVTTTNDNVSTMRHMFYSSDDWKPSYRFNITDPYIHSIAKLVVEELREWIKTGQAKPEEIDEMLKNFE